MLKTNWILCVENILKWRNWEHFYRVEWKHLELSALRTLKIECIENTLDWSVHWEHIKLRSLRTLFSGHWEYVESKSLKTQWIEFIENTLNLVNLGWNSYYFDTLNFIVDNYYWLQVMGRDISSGRPWWLYAMEEGVRRCGAH